MVFDRLQAELDLDTSGFKGGIDEAESKLDRLGGRTQRAGKKMKSAGSTMTRGVTAPLAALGAGSAKAAADFEQNMQNSIAVMGDVDSGMRKKLEGSARSVAKTTTRSHGEAAESFYFLASAGLDAQESLAAMPQVAAFAEAGQMNMAEATDTATNVMSAYGMEAENIGKVTDTMTGTVQNHNQTMEGMSAAFKNAAPAAAAMGIKIDSLAAATGMLGDVGIQGAEAGSALNSIMRRMAKRTGQAGKALDQMGVKTRDAQGNLLPLAEIIGQLEEKNMSAAQASKVFGRQQSAGLALVEGGSEALKENTKRIQESEGATRKMAETQRNTLKGSLQLLKSQLTDVAIQFGEHLTPAIQGAANAVSKASTVFGTLSSRQQKIIVAVSALVAAIGPLLLVLGTLATVAGAAVPALSALAGAIGLISAPVLAVIAVIALLAIAYQQDLGGMRDFTHKVLGAIRTAFQATFPLIKKVVTTTLNAIMTLWNSHSQTVFAAISVLVNGVIAAFRRLAAVLKPLIQTLLGGIMQFWRNNKATILEIVRVLTNRLETLFRVVYTVIKTLTDATLSVITALWRAFGDEIMVVVNAVFAAVKTYITVALDAISTALSVFLALIKGDWKTALNEILGFWKRTFNTVLSFFTAWVPRLIGAVTSALATIFQAFLNFGKKLIFGSLIPRIFNGILNFIVNSLAKIFGAIKTALTKIFTFWKTLFTKIFNFYKAIWTKIFSFAKTILTKVFNFFKTILTKIFSFWKTLFTKVFNFYKAIWTKIFSFAKKLLTKVFNFYKTILTKLFDLVKTILSKVFEFWKTILTKTFDVVKTFFNRIFQFISNTLSRIFDTVKRILNFIKNIFTSTLGAIFGAVTGKMGSIASTVTGKMGAAKDAVFGSLSSISSEFTSKLGSAASTTTSKLGQAKSNASSAMGSFKSTISSKLGAVVDAFSNKLDAVSGIASNIVGTAEDAASDARSALSDAQSAAGDAASAASDAASDAASAASSAADAGGSAVGDAASAIGDRNPFAKGGVVTGPTDALIGEGKEDEAVLPLSKLQTMLDLSSSITPDERDRIKSGVMEGLKNTGSGRQPMAEVSGTASPGSSKKEAMLNELKKVRDEIGNQSASIEDAEFEVTDDGLIRLIDGRIEFNEERRSIETFSRNNRI